MDPLTEQSEGPASSPTQPPRNFDFPTLNGDGSVSDLIETRPRPGERTPPAALSTLAHKTNMDNSLASLSDEQYDMVDDALSNDGETASIASTTDDFEDDIDNAELTPDETGSVADDEEGYPLSTPSAQHADNQPSPDLLEHEAAQEQEKQRMEIAGDSILEEDLERTLRQEDVDTAEELVKNEPKDATRPKKTRWNTIVDSVKTSIFSRTLLSSLFFSLVWAFIMSSVMTRIADSADDVALRRENLSASLKEWTNATDATKIFNIEHLLPTAKSIDTSAVGVETQATANVHFQGAAPSYIVVSLPCIGKSFPQLKSIDVRKGDTQIDFTQKKLIDGVYGIVVDPKEAYGVVTVNMPCTKPQYNVTITHNFGRNYLQLQKTQKDLTESLSKDVATARKAAKGLTDFFQLELGAGVAATKNVTTQLALQVSRDIQVFASTAASVLDKAVTASEKTAKLVSEDLQLARKDLVKVGSDAKEFVGHLKKEIKNGVTKAVTEPLVLSRERALMLKEKLLGRKAKKCASCTGGCSKKCKAGKSTKAGKKSCDRKSPITPSKQLKEQKPGRRYTKHSQKPTPKVLV